MNGGNSSSALCEKLYCDKQKAAPVARSGFEFSEADYFFFAVFALRFSSMAAWAAARRATGTRYGEQLT